MAENDPKPPDSGTNGAITPEILPASNNGRRTTLTPEVHKAIIDNVLAGCELEIAAGAVGIQDATVQEWMRKGQGVGHRRRREPYATFFMDVEKAKRECEARLATVVANAAVDNATFAMMILERKFPERWGRKDTMTLRGQPDAPIQIGLNFEKQLVKRVEGTDAQIEVSVLPPAGASGGNGHQGGAEGQA